MDEYCKYTEEVYLALACEVGDHAEGHGGEERGGGVDVGEPGLHQLLPLAYQPLHQATRPGGSGVWCLVSGVHQTTRPWFMHQTTRP